MKATIYGFILMCMMSLAGCGDSGNIAKLSGVSAGTILTSTDHGNPGKVRCQERQPS